ncbi:hypothetical protein B2G74_24925 [Burkholderia sp. A27]|nr:hypothetical protein B2G74_24925 [Burkholderia sp. A27]
MLKVTKAVFPVAGLGTRFLPATKASPKEMLPIVDKPLIQYAVEEAMAAGITEMIFVTGRSKRPCHEGEPERDAADRRQAADPIRGGRGDGGRHHRNDLRDGPQQARDRGPFR